MAFALFCSGKVLPLGNTQDLADLIVGSSAEAVELENLINQHQSEISAEVERDGADVNRISTKFYERLQSRGTQVNSLSSVRFYNPSPVADQNAQKWFEAGSMRHAYSTTTPVSKRCLTTRDIALSPWLVLLWSPFRTISSSFVQKILI